MSGGEILFLAHRIPFPPDRGDKIRSHHLLKAVAALASVHVATLADDPNDWGCEGELAAISESHCLVGRTKPVWRAGIEALLTGQPVSKTAFHDPALAAYVRRVLAERPIDTIVAFSSQMGQYIPDGFTGRVVYDFVDVDSAKFEAYAAKSHWPMAWIHAREARLLRAEEARLARRSSVSLLVSPEEAALFAARLGPEDRATCQVLGLRNGIDAVSFDPDLILPEKRMLAMPGPRLIFTGQMDYAPNVDAALRVIRSVLPQVRKACPDASFHVVGRNPPPRLRQYHEQQGVYVWGAVDDIRTWLAGAHIALLPLEIARGIQNKVLEAMAMRLPVVLSTGASTGIAAQDGRDFLICDEDSELAEAVIKLAASPQLCASLGDSARHFVVDEMSWAATLAPLAGLLGRNSAEARHAA